MFHHETSWCDWMWMCVLVSIEWRYVRLCEAIPDCEECSWQRWFQDAFWLQKSRRLGTARCDTLNTRNILFLGELLSVHCVCVSMHLYSILCKYTLQYILQYIVLYTYTITIYRNQYVIYCICMQAVALALAPFSFLNVFRFAPRSDGSLAYEGSWSCKKPLKLFHDVLYANKKGMESNR